jgi:Zn ribbon nucleic-acid-binding protein
MDPDDSARTPLRACPNCARLDIAHVGDTEKARWLECRQCGHVWRHSLPTDLRQDIGRASADA